MILNYINIQHQIQLNTGMVGILGKSPDRVTFIASGLDLEGYINPHMEHFAKNIIVMSLPGSLLDTIIFEVNLRGELRNPQRLLKSIRGKLKLAMQRAEQKVHQDLHEYLDVPDRFMPCAMAI